MKRREEAIQAIEGKSFDVCVIGGGATGSGCALDSQLRGLKTVQLEAEDFRERRFQRVYEDGPWGSALSAERDSPLRFQGIPGAERSAARARSHATECSVPHEYRGRSSFLVLTACDVAYFSVGLKLYDWIAGRDSLAASTFISREETLRRMPEIASENLLGAVVYADGQFDDARYNITLVKTFAEAGGETLNHAGVIAFEKDASGRLATAIVEEKVTRQDFPRSRAVLC